MNNSPIKVVFNMKILGSIKSFFRFFGLRHSEVGGVVHYYYPEGTKMLTKCEMAKCIHQLLWATGNWKSKGGGIEFALYVNGLRTICDDDLPPGYPFLDRRKADRRKYVLPIGWLYSAFDHRQNRGRRAND